MKIFANMSIEAESLKPGDIVRIKEKYQDSEDDGRFEVLEAGKGRVTIRSIDTDLKLPPIETVPIGMVYKAEA